MKSLSPIESKKRGSGYYTGKSIPSRRTVDEAELIVFCMERLAGYKHALHEAGIALDERLIKRGNWKFDSGLERAREFLAMSAPPTAIVAANDESAAGVVQAAWERGWNVPADLSVVGFDDVPLARQVWPPLTTVRQPIYDIAVKAMSMLVERIIPGVPVDPVIEIPTELIIRHSTGPCRR